MPSQEDHLTRREAYAAWLSANGIPPNHVPLDADVVIQDGTKTRQLRVEVWDLSPDGQKQIDERLNRVAVKTLTVPLVVEPPDWWQPYEKPTRDQLLDVIKDALPTLRGALAELPAVCRYHDERLDPVRPSYGSDACCDTGRPALRRRNAEEAVRALAAQLDGGRLPA